MMKASEPKPERLMRVVIPTATNNPHPISIKFGDRFPSDHEYVKRWPWAFISDDQPDYVGRAVAARYMVAEEQRGAAIAAETELRDRKLHEAPRDEGIPLERQRICIRACGPY